MDHWQQKMLEASIRMGISIQNQTGPTDAPAPAMPVPEAPIEAEVVRDAEVLPQAAAPQVVNPPPVKAEWEKEINDFIAKNGGTFEIALTSGTRIRVVQGEPNPASDVIEMSVDHFKRLSRAAVMLNGRVVDVMTKAEADARTQRLIDNKEGCWVSPNIFIEVNKEAVQSTGAPRQDFGIVAAPKSPSSPPPVDPRAWLSLSAGNIVEQVPMRISSGKVVGTLIRTQAGPLYARSVKDTEHRLNLNAPWALAGGYSIDREVYDKYLTDPATVIKMIRSDRTYLTTSGWIQRHGGLIRQWGTERVIMPLSGSYWLVVDNKSGETVE